MTSFGLGLPTIGYEPTASPPSAKEICEFAVRAEATGFNSLWTLESLTHRIHVLEPLEVLAAATAVTSRVDLGVGVVCLPMRSPLPLASQLRTLAALSQGRLIVGFGLGDRKDEYAASGIPWEGRGSRFEEQVKLLRHLLVAETADFNGFHFNIRGIEPSPHIERFHEIPILLGGGEHRHEGESVGLKEHIATRIVKLGDGWIAGGEMTSTGFVRALTQIKEELEDLGEDFSAFPVGRRVYVCLSEHGGEMWRQAESRLSTFYGKRMDIEDRVIVGSKESFKDIVQRYTSLNLDFLIFHPLDRELDHVDLIADALFN